MRMPILIAALFAYNLPTTAQSADFTFSTANGQSCTPVVVNFNPNVTGTPLGYLWNFGDGVQSNEINPTYTYAEPGTYQVLLTVVFTQQVVKVTKPIVVNPAFSISTVADRNYICKPGIINFTALGNGNISTYNWNFGDGATITGSSSTQSHNFSNYGSYTITLVATQNTGCIASMPITVSVAPPPIATSISQTNGCAPANINFGANVTVPINGNVISYKWNFGDGSPISTTTNNTSQHLYSTPHVGYNPSVTITTNEGCTNSASFGVIMLGTQAAATASPKADTVCQSDSIKMFAQSANTNLFNWNWGDGTNTVSASPSSHQYLSLGAKTISVSGYDNGCTGNASSVPVFIKGVIASFTYSNDCPNDSLFLFQNTSQGNPTSILWNFGDGITVGDNNSPTHQFNKDGAYTTNITVTDNISGCTEAYSKTLYIATPTLTSNKLITCRGGNVTFNVKVNYANPLATYTWNIDGGIYGATDSSAITIAADSLGVFHNSVVINNGLGYCPTTVNEANTLTVRGPDPQFSIPNLICLTTALQANNITPVVSNGDTIKTWQWNFGENTSTSSIYEPSVYSYSNAGNYNITLKATDQYNCTYAMVKPIQVAPIPFVLSLPHNDTLCLGQSKTLMAYHFDALNWTPTSSLNCATCDSITVAPTSDTKFIATATNSFGCTAMDTSNIKVYAPFKATSAFWDTAICLKDTLQLKLGPAGENVTWSPSNGLSNNNILNPLAYPSQTTAYTAILSDQKGCFVDTAHLNILVNPLPTVNAGPSASYPYNSTFSFQPTYSQNVVAYQWSPASQLSCTTCASPQGVADVSQTYTIKATSDSGCTAKDTVTIFVECMGANLLMPTAFTPSRNINNIYHPLSRGMKTITKFAIYNRLGQLVYQQSNFPPNDTGYGWDGKADSTDQPSGTYVYMVEAICDLGQTVSEKGTFVLIR